MRPFAGATSLHLGHWQPQVHPRLWLYTSKFALPAGSPAECTLQVFKAAPSIDYSLQWIGVPLQVRRLSAAPSTLGTGMNSSHSQTMEQLQFFAKLRCAACSPPVWNLFCVLYRCE